MASIEGLGGTKDQKATGKNPQRFRDLLEIIYGQGLADCEFHIPGLPDNGADWLDKFSVDDDCACPTCTNDSIHCNLLLAGHEIRGLTVANNKIGGKFPKDTEGAMLAAFAMAALAAANKNMMQKGVKLNGDKQEQLFLFMACQYYGLKVLNADKELAAQAAQSKDTFSDPIWKKFVGAIHACPCSPLPFAAPVTPDNTPSPPPPPPESKPVKPTAKLSDIFNREVPDNIRSHLNAAAVSPDIYKAISEDVVKQGDVKRSTLVTSYKEKFNLTHGQLDTIVKAMDEEGITSLLKGNRRVINYSTDGKPKEPAMA